MNLDAINVFYIKYLFPTNYADLARIFFLIHVKFFRYYYKNSEYIISQNAIFE